MIVFYCARPQGGDFTDRVASVNTVKSQARLDYEKQKGLAKGDGSATPRTRRLPKFG